MNTVRLSSLLSLSVLSFALASVGCAAPSDGDAEGADIEPVNVAALEESAPNAIALAAPSFASQLDGASLLCRARLVSTSPSPAPSPYLPGTEVDLCAAADPHSAQVRYYGTLEGGLTKRQDKVLPGTFSCSRNPVTGLSKCTKEPDRLIEETCTETRVYECPCGVETVSTSGGLAARCRK